MRVTDDGMPASAKNAPHSIAIPTMISTENELASG